MTKKKRPEEKVVTIKALNEMVFDENETNYQKLKKLWFKIAKRNDSFEYHSKIWLSVINGNKSLDLGIKTLIKGLLVALTEDDFKKGSLTKFFEAKIVDSTTNERFEEIAKETKSMTGSVNNFVIIEKIRINNPVFMDDIVETLSENSPKNYLLQCGQDTNILIINNKSARPIVMKEFGNRGESGFLKIKADHENFFDQVLNSLVTAKMQAVKTKN